MYLIYLSLSLIALHFTIAKQYSALSRCSIDFASNYNYQNFHKLYNIADENFQLNFKFYAVAKRDVFVVFSPVSNQYQMTRSYEFAIGADWNRRVMIRKLNQNYTNEVIFNEKRLEILDIDRPNEIHITMTNDSKIKIAVNQVNIYEKQDNQLFYVRYFAFASYKNSPNAYLYNCPMEIVRIEPVKKILYNCTMEICGSKYAMPEEKNLATQIAMQYIIAIIGIIFITIVVSFHLIKTHIRHKSVGSNPSKSLQIKEIKLLEVV